MEFHSDAIHKQTRIASSDGPAKLLRTSDVGVSRSHIPSVPGPESFSRWIAAKKRNAPDRPTRSTKRKAESMSGVWLLSYLALWILVIGIAVLQVALLREVGLIHLRLSPPEEGLELGSTAPELVAQDQAARQVYVNDYLATDINILLFVSASCEACKQLLAELHGVTEQEFSRYQIVVISRDRELAQSHPASRAQSPILFADQESQVWRDYRVARVPWAYVLDRRGVVRAKGGVGTIHHLADMAMHVAYPA